jgi:hypothetical protein
MTWNHRARRRQKAVDTLLCRDNMGVLAGHSDRPQLAGRRELTSSRKERRLADRTTGSFHESKTIMPSIIVQCRAAKLLNFVERFAPVAPVLEPSVFSPINQ